MKLKLFCIPYAGSSAFVFNRWKPLLNQSIELIPIELAGRGSRFKQPNYNCLTEAVLDVYKILKSRIDHKPYVILGHSMGAQILFELYYTIVDKNEITLPHHLFFSGTKPPHLQDDEWANLTDDEFINKLKEYGGTQEQIFLNKDLFNLVFPIIRRDIANLVEYKYCPKPYPVKCNVTVMGGLTDKNVPIDKLKEWEKLCSGNFNLLTYNSGHFFIFDRNQEVIRCIEEILLKKQQ